MTEGSEDTSNSSSNCEPCTVSQNGYVARERFSSGSSTAVVDVPSLENGIVTGREEEKSVVIENGFVSIAGSCETDCDKSAPIELNCATANGACANGYCIKLPASGDGDSVRNPIEKTKSNASRRVVRTMSSVPFKGRKSSLARFDCLERPLSIFFYKYGRFVSRQPWPFIIFPVLLTIGLVVGFLHANKVNDAIYLFTPTNAPSKFERAVIHEKWPVRDDNYIPGRSITAARECQVVIMSRGSGNILSPECVESGKRLNQFILNRVRVKYQEKEYSYQDLCLRWKDEECQNNPQVGLVGDLFNSGYINISFPSFRFGSKKVYLASSLGGVRLFKGANETNYIAEAKAWLMVFQLKFQPDNASYISSLWERELERQLLTYKDPNIVLTFLHSQSLSEELKRNGDTLVPRFAISFTMLIVFCVLCSFSFVWVKGKPYVDWVISTPILAACGVLNAGLGVVSAIGLLNFVGMQYNQIVLVMPFLVVAVGADSSFLMMASLHLTKRSHSVPKRMGESMSDAAVSITITSITDILGFGIGTITNIPAVQIFCVYTCMAILMTFLYQLTFYMGLVVLQARLEEKNKHTLFMFAKTVPAEEGKNRGVLTRMWMLGSRLEQTKKDLDDVHKSNHPSVVFFRDWYGPILMHPVVKLLVMIWFFIYLGFAIYGCCNVRLGLEPVNLLVKDSYAIPHYHALENYFWRYGTDVQIVVNDAPDLSDPEERQKIQAMISAFANTDHTIGPNGVQLWLDEFIHFTSYEISLPPDALNTAFYRLVRHFLSMYSYEKWSEDVYWDPENPERIKAFRFTVGMKDFQNTLSQQETTELMREVAQRYPQYNVTTFMPLWLFTDQYSQILGNTVQDVGIGMATMMGIALLLIPQPMCAFWVAVAIATMDVGVIGYMTFWGVNLDAISMITMVMSVGFSVDFSAHITYGYVVSEEDTPNARICSALGGLAWPICQGAASTVLGVALLAGVDSYMIVTFFKTVFLVIIIGSSHALIFIPVLLSVFVRGNCGGSSKSNKSSKSKTSKTSKKEKSKIRPVEPKPPANVLLPPLPEATPVQRTEDGQILDDSEEPYPYGPKGLYGIFLPRLSQVSMDFPPNGSQRTPTSSSQVHLIPSSASLFTGTPSGYIPGHPPNGPMFFVGPDGKMVESAVTVAPPRGSSTPCKNGETPRAPPRSSAVAAADETYYVQSDTPPRTQKAGKSTMNGNGNGSGNGNGIGLNGSVAEKQKLRRTSKENASSPPDCQQVHSRSLKQASSLPSRRSEMSVAPQKSYPHDVL